MSDEDRDELEAQQVLSDGPRVMARLCDGALLACIKRLDLKTWAQTYNPEDGGALIVGPTSIGKTAACVYAVKRLVKAHRAELRLEAQQQGVRYRVKGLKVVWVRAVDLAAAPLQHPLGEGDPPLIKACHEAQLLIVDDMGWEARSDTIAQVLAVRYDMGLPTVATSNYRVDALATRYGMPFLRRLLEHRGDEGQALDLFKAERAKA